MKRFLIQAGSAAVAAAIAVRLMHATASAVTSGIADLELISVTGGPPHSMLIDDAALMDFSMPDGKSPVIPAAARNNEFAWDETIPARLERLEDAPQFAPYLRWSIPELAAFTSSESADADAWTVLGVRYYQTNALEQSLTALATARRQDPRHERSAELYSAILVHAGDIAAATTNIYGMLDELPQNRIVRFNLSCAYALQSDTNQAMYHLQVLSDMGWNELRYYLHDPDLAALYRHAPFRDMAATLDKRAREWAVDLLRVNR